MNPIPILALLLFCHGTLNATPPTCEAARAMFRAQGVPEDQWPTCGGVSVQPPTTQQQNCACDSPTLKTCKMILDGFNVGSYDHANLIAFSMQITSELRTGQVRRLDFKGFADGTSDRSGAGDWSRVQVTECKRLSSGLFHDEALAELRRCHVRIEVERALGAKVSIAASESQHDYPTDKNYAKPELRKVEVTITRSENCR